MKLADIAHGRSGDKGDCANIGIVAYDDDDFAFLRSFLTEELVADVFETFLQHPESSSVDRFVLPELGGLNFVLYGSLDGGASESLRTDVQGKTFAAMLLRVDITEPYATFDG
ncbi:AtuA-related protein [Natrinema halophilum]|uniref:AtuA-related protein n=1 Tax=Natrinema halophilum TaxID=1699371 RepID=UPI001F20EDAE|nr:hypothetical protein [Natrinema halophilum]UHQ96319.1 hypothetical protein HYG82_21920 [Natrinema halophilum]